MAKQYEVPTLGTGAQDDPFRPDIPVGVSFVGQHDPETNTYTVIVHDDVVVERSIAEDKDIVDSPKEELKGDEKPAKVEGKAIRTRANTLKGFSLS